MMNITSMRFVHSDKTDDLIARQTDNRLTPPVVRVSAAQTGNNDSEIEDGMLAYAIFKLTLNQP